MTDPSNWDILYQNDVPPPWDIGKPQPALAPFIPDAQSDTLDSGCGTGALTNAIAAQGIITVGLDISSVALFKATDAATQSGLSTVTFTQADVTNLTGYDGRFATIFDSGCLSSLSPDQWPTYLDTLSTVGASGANLYMLTRDEQSGSISEDELRQLVSVDWTINTLTTANIYCGPSLADMFGMFPNAVPNGDGYDVSGYLLTATKGTA